MNSLNTPTIDRLNEVFRYDPETGLLYWKKKSGRKVRVGKIAGTKRVGGKKHYLHLSLDKKFLTVHRIAWAMTYREWPETVDHINGNGLDNRIVNLRSVSHRTNCLNARKADNNTSGVTGVIWLKCQKLWRASIKVHKKNVYLGKFKNIQDAIDARKNAEVFYGFHENHGSSRPHFGPDRQG